MIRSKGKREFRENISEIIGYFRRLGKDLSVVVRTNAYIYVERAVEKQKRTAFQRETHG